MRYLDQAVGSCLIPKLLGSYERELAFQIHWICGRKPTLIANIGAGEGYYAVGLALRNPGAHVIAFEMQQIGQDALRAMAELNGVADRLTVRGRCEASDLAEVLDGRRWPVAICDVEGDEEKLLNPQAVAALLDAIILVEVHEFVRRGITGELRRRFAASHHIERISQEPRSRAEFPWRTLGTTLLPASYLDWAVGEWRPERMSWLWMTPKSIDA